tara:strand:- start:519 stop:860 length:342 start_codon:yes stop_codon:yes gene_type:complete
MIPKTLNFKKQYQGNSFNGWRFTMTDGNNAPIDLTNVSVLMQIKDRNGDTIYKNFTIGKGFTLISGTGGVIDLDPFINISAGDYVFDITFNYGNNVIKTYAKGSYSVQSNSSN